mgnify:FL=1
MSTEINFGYPNGDQIVGSISTKEQPAKITRLFVDEKRRKKGIGAKLLTNFERTCNQQGVRKIEIVLQDNIPNRQGVINFLIHRGFLPVNIKNPNLYVKHR